MFKLVAVAGVHRGEEFELNQGENIVGRDDSADITINSTGVSKSHFSVVPSNDSCFLKDLGSSNGTFINGNSVKSKTLKDGDKIAIPDNILQVVFVKENKKIIKKLASDDDEDDNEDDFLNGGHPPSPIPLKLKWLFKYKIMKPIYGINEEYEWSHMVGILLTIFCVAVISLTIFPVLNDSKIILLNETAKRGGHYVDEVARMNKKALVERELHKIDTEFIINEDGVKDYRLFDLQGRIIRPMEKINESISQPDFVDTLNWAKNRNVNKQSIYKKLIRDGQIVIAKLIFAVNSESASEEPVGIITIRFRPTSLVQEASKARKAYLEALTTTILVSIFFFGFLYFMTIRPIEELRFNLEEALRGNKKTIEGKFLMTEITGIKNSANTMLQRIRQLSNEEEDDIEFESDTPYVNNFKELMSGLELPILILDQDKNLAHINLEAEDVVGIRESQSQGSSLMDLIRDQGFSATVVELCDNSANAQGTNEQRTYDIGGIPYEINVVCALGKDTFPKAYFISLKKES